MVIDKKTENTGEEKKWDNPQDPENTSDNRDRDQIARQYREAKRRHDNLTEDQDNESNEQENKDK